MPKDRVEVRIGQTVNLGNFESVRFDVGLGADVRKGQTRKQVYKDAGEWVSSRVNDLVREVRAALKGKKKKKRRK